MKIRYLETWDVGKVHMKAVSAFRDELHVYLMEGEEEYVYNFKGQGRRADKASLRIKIDGPTAQAIYEHIKWLDYFIRIQEPITGRVTRNKLWSKRANKAASIARGTVLVEEAPKRAIVVKETAKEKDTYVPPLRFSKEKRDALKKWRKLKVDPIQ